MNKGDLISKVADDASISKNQASEAVNSVLNAISDTLKGGEKTTLIGFGTFLVNERSARMGRNPQTGKAIEIPAKKVVKFKPGKELTALLN